MSKGKIYHKHLATGALIAIILLALLIAFLDLRKVARVLFYAQWYRLTGAFIFTIFAYIAYSYAFVILNRVFGIKVKRLDLFIIGCIATAISSLLAMAGLAGYSFKVLAIKKYGYRTSEILAPSLFEGYLHILVLFGLFPFGLFSLFASNDLTKTEYRGLIIGSLLFLLLIILATIIFFYAKARSRVIKIINTIYFKITKKHLPIGIDHLNKMMSRMVQICQKNPLTILFSFMLIIIDWFCTITALWFCFYALRSMPSFSTLLSGFTISLSLGTLSMIPGGLGVQEASMAGIYTFLGVNFEKAVLVTILYRFIYYILPFLLSLVYYKNIFSAKKLVRSAEAGKLDKH